MDFQNSFRVILVCSIWITARISSIISHLHILCYWITQYCSFTHYLQCLNETTDFDQIIGSNLLNCDSLQATGSAGAAIRRTRRLPRALDQRGCPKRTKKIQLCGSGSDEHAPIKNEWTWWKWRTHIHGFYEKVSVPHCFRFGAGLFFQFQDHIHYK